MLFRVGDRRYPFMAIIEGQAAILDAAGHEIVRHGASGFLGEMNLMSGQTVFLTAVVTQAMRYIAVDREALRPLLPAGRRAAVGLHGPARGLAAAAGRRHRGRGTSLLSSHGAHAWCLARLVTRS